MFINHISMVPISPESSGTCIISLHLFLQYSSTYQWQDKMSNHFSLQGSIPYPSSCFSYASISQKAAFLCKYSSRITVRLCSRICTSATCRLKLMWLVRNISQATLQKGQRPDELTLTFRLSLVEWWCALLPIVKVIAFLKECSNLANSGFQRVFQLNYVASCTVKAIFRTGSNNYYYHQPCTCPTLRPKNSTTT